MRFDQSLEAVKGPLAWVAGFSFFVNLLLLAPALFMLQLFDRVLTSQSHDTLLMLLVGVGIALALTLALDYLRSRLQGVAGSMISDALSPTIAKIMLARAAERSNRAHREGLRDVAALRNLFSAQGLLAVFDAPWAVVYVAVIWLAHPVLGIAASASAVLMLVLAVANDRITRRGIEGVQRQASEATRWLENSMHNAEVVQSLGMADALLDRWRQLNGQVATLQRPTAQRSVAMAATTRMVRQAVQVLMQALGAYLVITGEGSPGVMVATTILLGRALAPVEQVVGSWRVLAEGRLALSHLRELLDGAPPKAERMPLPPPTGRLAADNVVFRTSNDDVVLAGVSLQVAPGEALAIVGPSGAGKSTLLRLLTGVWRPSAGVVRLDHVDLAQWPREEIGPWLGYVPQGVELFAGTVAQNIARLGAVDADQVVRAAQRAGVHEMILSLPQGYETVVEPGGAVLSPGQRQRIAFARALYGDPKLVILDEPNSNLDGAGELALGEAIKALHGTVTVVLVTHRSSLMQHVDQALVLEHGRVKHYGPLAEVMQALRPTPQAQGAQVVAMPRPATAGVRA